MIIQLSIHFNAVSDYYKQVQEYRYIGFLIPERIVTKKALYKGI